MLANDRAQQIGHDAAGISSEISVILLLVITIVIAILVYLLALAVL